jgi:hypothetical protein
VLNHGISDELMDEVERLTKAQYANCREHKFQEFARRTLEAGEKGADVKDVDWESTFFVRHRQSPTSPTSRTSTTTTGTDTLADGTAQLPSN